MKSSFAGVRIALIGANGMLAQMIRFQSPDFVDLQLYDFPDFDICCHEKTTAVLTEAEPDVIINCAAFTNVDGCESNRDAAYNVNGNGPKLLAGIAKQLDALLIHISTDFVFSGAKDGPYLEDDETKPLSVYGLSKLKGEGGICRSPLQKYYIIRTSWLYGPYGSNFVETIARLAFERDDLGIVSDQVGSPTYTGDLARFVWNLVENYRTGGSIVPYGVYHFSNQGSCSWYEFAQSVIEGLKSMGSSLRLRNLRPIRTEEYPLPAKRPRYSVLSKEKVLNTISDDIPFWQESLSLYLKTRESYRKEQ